MYSVLLIGHFLGVALGVGTGFAYFTLGLAGRGLDPEARTKFFFSTLGLSKNGSIGLALLLVTGIGMMASRGFAYTMAWGGHAFHAKLTLVLIMIGLLGFSQATIARIKREQGGPALARMPLIGRALLLTSVSIVICAVLAFN